MAPTGQPAAGSRVVASPYARKLASDSGIDLALIQGSGPAGRVEASDVEKAKKEGVVRNRYKWVCVSAGRTHVFHSLSIVGVCC